MKIQNKKTIILFIIFSCLVFSLNLIKYGGINQLVISIISVIFSLSVLMLLLFAVNKLIKLKKRDYFFVLFYLVISSLAYWIVVSTALHFLYGTFLNLSGIYFFLVTRTFLGKLLFYLASALIPLILTAYFFYDAKKNILNEEKIEKINKKISKEIKKNLPEQKILNKKINVLYFLIPILIVLFIIVLLPPGYSSSINPIIDLIKKLLSSRPDIQQLNNTNFTEKEKILNISSGENLNVIIIMLESVPTEKMGYYGYEKNTTPNIDSLAEKSIVFNKTYSSASHSDYSQPTFLSSRYALSDEYRNFFDENYPRNFIWDILKKQNYSTAYISSQDDEWGNMIYYYNTSNLDTYSYSLTDSSYDYGSGKARNDYDEVTINKAVEWVKNASKPFFIYINLQATHYPYEYPPNNSVFLPDETDSLFTTYFSIAEEEYNATVNRYDNAVYYVDKQVGTFLAYLEKENLFNNSFIVVTSDHGEILEKRHGYIRHGFGLYEEEVRVPLIFSIPGQGHEVINKNVAHIDVIPTILSILNFTLSKEFQGTEFRENPEIFMLTQNQNFKIGTVKDDIKYVLDMHSYLVEVYNLTADPLEQDNLIKTTEDEESYTVKYGVNLFQWYDCQLDYYQNKKWEDRETINCQDSRLRGSFSSLKPKIKEKHAE